MKPFILAHDLGTTGDKASLFDREGICIASVTAVYPTEYPETGWAEQNPNDWWRAVCASTHDLLSQTNARGDQIACVVFSGQMQGVVALDADARPLRSALIWADQRSTAQVQWLRERLDESDLYRITGHRLSAAYSLTKILWLRDHQPDIYRAAYKFTTVKEAIAARLTGQFVTEPSDASGTNMYDLHTGAWSAAILDAAALDVERLPTIGRSVDVIGTVTPGAAEQVGLSAGTPVVIGGGDGACAGVGAGSVYAGVAYSYIGSSGWIATSTRAPIVDPARRTFTFAHVVPGLYMPMGTMQAAGLTYQWLRDHLSPIEKQSADALGISPYVLMNAVAETSPPGAENLIFLPYLIGERAPRWNPDARGAYIGLTVRHTRADMLRAAMEGVVLNLKVILNALREHTPIESIRVIGGGVSGRLWAHIMADVYDLPIHRLAQREGATSMGAAVIGGVGIGAYPDFSIAQRMNGIEETIYPNPANRAVYDAAYAIFESAYAALEPIYTQMARRGES
ncbi:MAG: xylulokinase [Chloroflexota bacterium]|nr:xylulokinase [Chloroflexota bacterium]